MKNQCHGITTNIKKPKINVKSKGTIYSCIRLFDTLVTPMSEYGTELWAIKGLKKLEKTNVHVHLYKSILSAKQSTVENFVYGELGRRPCQFSFRWREVKFWNRLIGLPQGRFAYKALQVAFEPFQQQFIRKKHKNTPKETGVQQVVLLEQPTTNPKLSYQLKGNIYKLFDKLWHKQMLEASQRSQVTRC